MELNDRLKRESRHVNPDLTKRKKEKRRRSQKYTFEKRKQLQQIVVHKRYGCMWMNERSVFLHVDPYLSSGITLNRSRISKEAQRT